MSVKIRLARAGSKKRPYYHIVIAATTSPRDGKFIDVIGSFNPMLAKDSADRVKLDAGKAAEWLKKGAQPTDRVARFLSVEGLAQWQAGNNPKKAEPGRKAKERAEERAQREADRLAAEEAAKAEAAAAAAAASEAPAEEAVADEAPAEEAQAEA